MKNYYLLLGFTLCGALSLRAQDLHFSQFNENPSLINPALTGVDGLRASVNYKSQWRSVTTPYKTYGASFEMRNAAKKKKGDNTNAEKKPGRFAAGLSVYKDRAGDGRMSLTQVNLSLATFVPTGENSALSVGIQGSFAQRSIDNGSFLFPDQYGESGYSTAISSGETFGSQRFGYADFGAGILWSFGKEERGVKNHKQTKAHIGGAAYHLTQPGQKYLQAGNQPLYMRYVAHGDLLLTIPNSRTAIQPSCLVQLQNNSMEILAGAMFRYYTKNDTRYTGYVKRNCIGLGAYYRNSDALIASALLEWKEQYAIGISYDVNISGLSKASGVRGGLELTLRYNSANGFLYQKMK